jgi:hypothetical protein
MLLSLAFVQPTMSDDLFDFKDLVVDIPAAADLVSVPLRSDQQPPGALHESSPAVVASEAMGGAGK